MDITKHQLVPRHSKLGDAEKKKLLESYGIETAALPKILKKDPVLAKLGVKEGDIIKVERTSKTAGTAWYYRVVTNG